MNLNFICAIGSALSELLRAVEDYLPILLGLVNDGNLKTTSQNDYHCCWG